MTFMIDKKTLALRAQLALLYSFGIAFTLSLLFALLSGDYFIVSIIVLFIVPWVITFLVLFSVLIRRSNKIEH